MEVILLESRPDMDVLGAAAGGAFEFGLLVTAFWFGFRHGIDWDHLAAITDVTSSQDDRRQALLFGTLYVAGHALVVLVLGIGAIIAGSFIPENLDHLMTKIVGVTLVLLGVYVFVALIRHGKDFRLRSRWMLIFAGVRKGARWARSKVGRGAASDSMAVAESEMDENDPTDPSLWHHGHHGHPGHHHHDSPSEDDAFMNYGRGTSFVVGMIHGIGAETPTQVLIFLTAAGTGGKAAGVAVLLAFIVGLVVSNSIITVSSAYGFIGATKNWAVYATVAVITGVFSLVIGILFLVGQESLLPAVFGG